MPPTVKLGKYEEFASTGESGGWYANEDASIGRKRWRVISPAGRRSRIRCIHIIDPFMSSNDASKDDRPVSPRTFGTNENE
jgi:hypothetical protein